ncbi:hypothetical protein LDENG_00221400, partial [Lucifuga dentata]
RCMMVWRRTLAVSSGFSPPSTPERQSPWFRHLVSSGFTSTPTRSMLPEDSTSPIRWMGSACRGRFPVEGIGAVTRSSSAATGTGTVQTDGTS